VIQKEGSRHAFLPCFLYCLLKPAAADNESLCLSINIYSSNLVYLLCGNKIHDKHNTQNDDRLVSKMERQAKNENKICIQCIIL